MLKDPLHATHRAARELAFARSNGICQFCGQYKPESTDSYRWTA